MKFTTGEGVAAVSLFFATLLSRAILPLAKMNKNILRRDSACTGWIGFTNLTGITNELSSKFLLLNHITGLFGFKMAEKFKMVEKGTSSICTARIMLLCFKGPKHIQPLQFQFWIFHIRDFFGCRRSSSC